MVCVVWQQHVLHIKTAIPSSTLLSRLSFQCTNQIAVFRSDHPFRISSYHISELLFTSLYLSLSHSVCVCAISVCSKCSTEHTTIQQTMGKALTFEFNLISFEIHSNCVWAMEYAMHLYNFNDVHSLFRFQNCIVVVYYNISGMYI